MTTVKEGKYAEYVGDLLEPIKKQLIKEQCKLDSHQQLHPKMKSIASMLEELLCDPQSKILILVRRYFDCCFTVLSGTLRSLRNAVVLKYPREVAEERKIYDVISKANVIVAELSSELQFCPWRRITHVFEFEYRKESEWCRLCFEQNPDLKGYFAFDCPDQQSFFDKGRWVRYHCRPSTGRASKLLFPTLNLNAIINQLLFEPVGGLSLLSSFYAAVCGILARSLLVICLYCYQIQEQIE